MTRPRARPRQRRETAPRGARGPGGRHARAAPAAASGLARERSRSMATTSTPPASRRLTVAPTMNPAPPVATTRMGTEGTRRLRGPPPRSVGSACDALSGRSATWMSVPGAQATCRAADGGPRSAAPQEGSRHCEEPGFGEDVACVVPGRVLPLPARQARAVRVVQPRLPRVLLGRERGPRSPQVDPAGATSSGRSAARSQRGAASSYCHRLRGSRAGTSARYVATW